MSPRFRVVDHVAQCSHTREYPRATSNGDSDRPKLAVKQYIPLDNQDPKPGDVTIIAGHANGFPKEMYEPLWDELSLQCQDLDLKIRSIWIADVWNQGQSGLLNKDIFGNDPNWFDHSRDLLYFINQQQNDMPHPIVGIGHSMGGTQLAYLSLLHPRLLRALILIDPVIQRNNPGMVFGAVSTRRRDVWPSREAAREKSQASKFYQAWDSRVFDQWMKYGLVDMTEGKDANASDVPVTLTTRKEQELFMFERPTYRGKAGVHPVEDKENYADLDPTLPTDYPGHPFYRPEAAYVFDHLPELRPQTMYVFGDASPLEQTKKSGPPDTWNEKVARTGVGVGGGGGSQHGQVSHVVVPDAGHLVAFEKVTEIADHIAKFLSVEIKRWKQDAAEFKKSWIDKPQSEKSKIEEEWKANVDYKQFGTEQEVEKKSKL